MTEHGYSRALEAQVDLQRWAESDVGHAYMADWGARQMTLDQPTGVTPDRMIASRIDSLDISGEAKRILNMSPAMALTLRHFLNGGAADKIIMPLRYGTPYFWASHICRLIDVAASKLTDGWTMLPQYVPSPQGFFYFDSPIGDPDGLPIKALAWSIHTSNDSPPATGRLKQVFLPAVGGGNIQTAQGITLMRFTQNQYGQLRFSGEGYWDFGTTHHQVRSVMPDDASQRVMAACLAFIHQRILVPSPGLPLDRATRRRLDRGNYVELGTEPLVRVIQLRRKQYDQAGNQHDVDWTCQWIVSGHWRETFYPSLSISQPKWIMPYIKGPEGKPLKDPGSKLFAVLR